MQFRDLKRQYVELKEEIDCAIKTVVEETNFISGKQVQELEKQLAEYVGVKHCITCGNGTDALTMMLKAWEIKEGDAVFVPDFTFFASGEVVSFEGATPVFYDVDEVTYNADVHSLEAAIQKVLEEKKLTPKVIIAVDLFGMPADYDKLAEVAQKYGLYLLEDGAQGFGGELHGRKACSFGDAATTSFFPAKPLGCYGDGGAIFTNDDNVDAYLRSIRVHGKGDYKYDNVRIGWNSRLDTMQAAILLAKLDKFKDYEVEQVNHVAKEYTKQLSDVVKTPVVPEGFYSSWAQYTIQVSDKNEREALQAFLKEHGVPTMVYYPKPMHLQTAFSEEKEYVSCSISEKLCETVLSLPMHPYLTDDEVSFVSDLVRKFYEEVKC